MNPDYIRLLFEKEDIDQVARVWKTSLTETRGESVREYIEYLSREYFRRYGRRRADITKEDYNFRLLLEDFDEERYQSCGKDDPNDCLLYFVKRGDVPRIKLAIKRGANNWGPAMQVAARYGELELVKFFFEKGGRYIDVALAAAARGGYSDIVEYLVEKAAELPEMFRVRYFDPDNIMVAAARGGHLALVQFFIEKGASDWDNGLIAAARGGHLALIDFFIEKGADDWDEAMAAATRGNNPKLIEFFIAKGANRWNLGLEAAASKGNIKLVKYFLDKGANYYNLAFDAAAEGGHIELMDFLLRKGARLNTEEWNALLKSEARHFGRVDVVKYLVEHGADDLDGAFEGAVESGNTEIVKYLAKIGVGANKLNYGLYKYAKYNDMKLVRFFVEMGADELKRALSVTRDPEIKTFLIDVMNER